MAHQLALEELHQPIIVNSIDDCACCLEETVKDGRAIGDLVLTSCGHLYHAYCLNNWEQLGPFGARELCPICRTPLDMVFFDLENFDINNFPLFIQNGAEIRQN